MRRIVPCPTSQGAGLLPLGDLDEMDTNLLSKNGKSMDVAGIFESVLVFVDNPFGMRYP